MTTTRGTRGGPFPPRVVIEQVSPRLEDAGYPVKRVIGERVEVGAVVYKDGHDLVSARVRYRAEGDARWRTEPLAYDYDSDRWSGGFVVDRLGRWHFTVEAWTDHWESWRTDLRKRVEADQDVAAELLEGAALLGKSLPFAPKTTQGPLTEAQARLADPKRSLQLRIGEALSEELAVLAREPIDPEELTRHEPILEVLVDRREAAWGAWYELFPRSQATKGRHGTFRDVEKRLPELAKLGFDVLYLPPIHPIGRAHRKGPNNAPVAGPQDPGSPWAIGGEEGGHTAVHPQLGTLADFERLVDSARGLGIEVALDYALQCSPDHPWLTKHPDWFHVRCDGTIRYAENPPKRYQDIYPLNFWCRDREALWSACRDIVTFWIDRGVRIFRVDNPHTKPFSFWEWLIREIQSQHPDVVFLAEAFTRPNRMRGLAKLGFNQSYTYFTWKNTSGELEEYLTELTASEMAEYYRPNFFTNTPDILHEYLQKGGRAAFRVRLLLAATLSPLYGIYSGFELCENAPVRPGSEEYLDSEKYQICHRDWNAPGNINDDIRIINRIRRENPALQVLKNLTFPVSENPKILWYRKSAPGNELMVAVNLDPVQAQEGMVHVPIADLGMTDEASYEVEDLLSGDRYSWRGARNYIRLDPAERVGHVLRLTPSASPAAK